MKWSERTATWEGSRPRPAAAGLLPKPRTCRDGGRKCIVEIGTSSRRAGARALPSPCLLPHSITPPLHHSVSPPMSITLETNHETKPQAKGVPAVPRPTEPAHIIKSDAEAIRVAEQLAGDFVK